MIDILYSGYSYRHEDGLVFDTDQGRPGFDSHQIIFAHTAALFWVDGVLRQYPPRSVVLFTPGHRKYYTSLPGEAYENDWILFDTDEAFLEHFPFPNVPFSPEDPDFVHEVIKLIAWEHRAGKGPEDPEMRDLFQILIAKMSDGNTGLPNGPYRQELVSLRREMNLHPEQPWSVGGMAERLNLGRTRFQTLYRTAFGVSCMKDVIDSRIRLAKDWLRYTSRSVSQIAEACGYQSTEHFCRQFLKTAGCSPGAFRRANGVRPDRKTPEAP